MKRSEIVPQYRRQQGRKDKVPTVRQQAIAQRRKLALELRTAGASYQMIVDAGIGYGSTAHVSLDMKKILQAFEYETPEDVIILDLARLDELQRIATLEYRRDHQATDANLVLRIMQFRRETLGLTPEAIEAQRREAQQGKSHGIMVVQGSPQDYLEAMMTAAGASPAERKKELEKIASSNRTDVIDAEVVEDAVPEDVPTKKTSRKKSLPPRKKKTHDEDIEARMEDFDRRQDRKDAQREELPSAPLSGPLLNVDVPTEDVPQNKSVRRLRRPLKAPDANEHRNAVPYRNPPRKPDVPTEPLYEEFEVDVEVESHTIF